MSFGLIIVMGKKSKLEGVISKKHDKHEKQEFSARSRHQSRRAASKEALKQMQMLLEDEDDTVEIPDDDDDVIPIPAVVPPPKKKYKLTHRKSSDGNDREVLVLKSITPNITNHNVENNLDLECWVEELEPCQLERNKKLKEEETALQTKLDELIRECKGEVVEKGDLTTIVEVSEHVQKTIQAVQASNNKPPIVLNSTVPTQQPSYQIVMDSRLGLVLGSSSSPQTPSNKVGKVPISKSTTNAQPTISPSTPSQRLNRATRGKRQPPVIQPSPTPQISVTTRSTLKKIPAVQPPPPQPTPPATRSRGNINVTSPVTKPNSKRGVSSATPTLSTTDISTTQTTRASSAVSVKPTENSVEGGLSTGSTTKPKTIVDLTTDDGTPLPDSKEISFNKLQGRTFPSLVVVARPHLRASDVNSDRAKLDSKVKSVLMYQAAKSTEWLIQQGLIKSQQTCSAHSSNQLKLGMYSDVTKFPHSGGYVWISECCPQRFVSVFNGSIFEGAPHPPLTLLKILYHWACQTNIQNVTQWVKVDNLYVKSIYTWLRAVCTAALQSHVRQLGGAHSKVEVGVISLGTTSQDGNSRQVKVEVLGVLETASKLIRLRAVEPLAEGDRNYRKRFSKILEPLNQWVHPSTTIITDLTVDKATLNSMGFTNVLQSTSSESNASNKTIMEYLRKIVPRMFQNTLSLLSRQIIQQFLDELVWREWFGTTSTQAFDNLVAHLAELTRYESNQSLIMRLNRIASNPFKNCGIPNKNNVYTPAPINPAPKPVPVEAAIKKRKRKETELPKASQPVTPEVNRPPKSTSPDVPEQMVPLENYYYGTIDNYPPKTKVTLNMKCPYCKEMFNNNIVLMNHLFKHAHNVSKDGQMCRYCLASVPTANDLLKHIASSHPVETKHDNGFVCLICETQYMNPFVLGKHMSKEHCPSELPYQCGTCGYRCSNHKQVIDHFYKQHDNGPTIQCPFCLKSTTVFSSSRNIVQNMTYFFQHLQKHQKKQFARRCGKCNLWFVQKDVLKEHQMKMHVSQRGKTGLVPWSAPRNGVMVPKSKMDKYPCDAEGINFNTLYFNLSKNLKCKECNLPMDNPKHFPSFESCQNPNCQYSTCCSNAMQEHNAKCSKSFQSNIPNSTLPYEMFCVCGYSSEDGNKLAKHLAICERKSAYPSVSDAKSASVTHSMLDVLGLVRKPEEADKKQALILRSEDSLSESSSHKEEKIPVKRTKPAPKNAKRFKSDVTETSLNALTTSEETTNLSQDIKNTNLPLQEPKQEINLVKDQESEEVKEKPPDLLKPINDLKENQTNQTEDVASSLKEEKPEITSVCPEKPTCSKESINEPLQTEENVLTVVDVENQESSQNNSLIEDELNSDVLKEISNKPDEIDTQKSVSATNSVSKENVEISDNISSLDKKNDSSVQDEIVTEENETVTEILQDAVDVKLEEETDNDNSENKLTKPLIEEQESNKIQEEKSVEVISVCSDLSESVQINVSPNVVEVKEDADVPDEASVINVEINPNESDIINKDSICSQKKQDDDLENSSKAESLVSINDESLNDCEAHVNSSNSDKTESDEKATQPDTSVKAEECSSVKSEEHSTPEVVKQSSDDVSTEPSLSVNDPPIKIDTNSNDCINKSSTDKEECQIAMETG
ncbi:uncharacterized protein LOC143202853 isoform X2 [Rhynchophorus ferrugineus]|uniref:uncharacterized protein LOC143202853 isoform X2 n=1 Tax=Rhynchophorus ferrugineus TaxID=354439 RepID=UPI003FCE547F